ncbi:MAG: NUDIX domain-containing protein [Sciscionella sp.]
MRRTEYYHQRGAPVAERIVVSATACVFDEAGALLLVRRSDNDTLTLPGGAQQIGETLAHTAVREVKEETGVNIAVSGLIGIYSDPEYVIAFPDGHVGQEFAVSFRAHPVGGVERTSAETSAVQWAAPGELAALDIAEPIRLRIGHATAQTDTPFYT